MYDNTKQKMVAHVGTCYILIHQEALLDVINVLMTLMKDTGFLAAQSKTPAAATAVPVGTRVSKTAQVTRKLSQTTRRLLIWLAIYK